MRRATLDTDTLSYLLRGNDPDLLKTMQQYLRVFRRLTVSAVTLAEVVEGLAYASDTERLGPSFNRQRATKYFPSILKGLLLPVAS